jgi:signal transduction histidine kinase
MAAAEAEARAAAVANERLRMARDLHDTLSHSLVALHAQIRLMRAVFKSAPERMAEVLGQAETAAADGVARARAAILDIRDRQGDEDDPVRDLRGMAAAFAARTGIAAEIEISVERLGLSREAGDVALRIAEEALRNVERHANATRVEMRVELVGDKRAVRVVIADNGAGFDPALRKPGHFGLVGIEEQVRAVGGSLDIESAPGKGTRLRVLLPVDTTGNEDPSSRTRAERTRPP